jgi:hypothetical protein
MSQLELQIRINIVKTYIFCRFIGFSWHGHTRVRKLNVHFKENLHAIVEPCNIGIVLSDIASLWHCTLKHCITKKCVAMYNMGNVLIGIVYVIQSR